MKDKDSRTVTVSFKVAAHEKIRYNRKARKHGVTFSEWAASIINMYEDAYDELKINSIREEELLYEIDKLRKQVRLLETLNDNLKIRVESKKIMFNS
ncbi:hypothetical protein KO566_04215 [Flavobacteriaceae bacterium XHP0103]|uniref:hypothetical protein n=1 Tax=Marixanthotalea marina TaxID=2844359 RepID=UPI002989D79E|nr:hypothetical protein [Marixanthotalea marina]MBU3821255.1 hypothetical protein [Marixanthotalea marina]